MEGVVLFRVKHLQQSRGRIAIMSHLGHLIDFIENEHWIARAGLLDRLDDTSGHGSNIGTAVSANLCLVMQTAKGNPYILTLHGFCNRLSK